MAAVLLHLSDIHIRSNSDWILSKSSEIACCLFPSLPTASAVFVVVSGDIAFGGQEAEYAAAKKLFDGIRAAIHAERDVSVHFVIAPGNHDCNFDLDNGARQLILKGLRDPATVIDDSIIDTGCQVQQPFRDFAESQHTAGETRSGDKLWTSHRFTVDGREVVFDVLNVSWCSQKREEQGSLVFPHARYAKKLDEVADLRISVIHHPLNWFSQGVYHEFRQLLRGLSNIIISGHEHVGAVGEDTSASTGHSAYIEGCILQDGSNHGASSFNIIELNLDEGTYSSKRYQWDVTAGHYSATEEGSWSDFRSIPRKIQSRFPLTDKFKQLITDPGAALTTQTGSQMRLADLYVYSDMQEVNDSANVNRILSTSYLKDFHRLEGGVLLSGEEKVGTTSLLFMLYSHFHDLGMLPVYVRGMDLKSSADRDLDAAIKHAVVEQYGEEQVVKFEQTSSSKKVLLLDDLDDNSIRSAEQRAKVLVALQPRFKYFVVTVSELFDFQGSVALHADGNLANLKEYQVLPFGYALRAQLVRRWIQRTSDDGSLEEATMLARIHRAERLMDSVMDRNIVPALPLYLLTLMRSIDTGESGNFEESGLGEYYGYLIKEGLNSAKVAQSEWGKVIEYCTHLAWVMHASAQKEMSLQEMREFNAKYSEKEMRVELEPRLKSLMAARILASNGEYYRFRYHYIFYYLKGRYLASRLGDADILSHVKDACAHLYVRENANTILFLAHHAFDKEVFIEAVLEALKTPFSASKPIEFRNSDTSKIADFIRDLPALKYTGESPEQMREERNRRRDESGTDDGLSDERQEDAATNFLSQMVALLKTVEILGQILKNQVASVSRARRVELLKDLVEGPLRLVTAYFKYIEDNKEQAQFELAERIRKTGVSDEERARKQARRLLAQLVQFSSFGFMLKAVTSVSSEDLLEDIETAAGAIGSPASKMIALGVRLDSPRDLPRKELSAFMEEVQKDFIGLRVLQFFVLNRLYMFRTNEKDKQWLDSQDVLDLKIQRAMDVQSRGQKKLASK